VGELGSGLLGREHPTLIRVPLCPTPNAKMPKYKLVMFDSDGTLVVGDTEICGKGECPSVVTTLKFKRE